MFSITVVHSWGETVDPSFHFLVLPPWIADQKLKVDQQGALTSHVLNAAGTARYRDRKVRQRIIRHFLVPMLRRNHDSHDYAYARTEKHGRIDLSGVQSSRTPPNQLW
jgi:hypothetical protein